MARFTQYLTNCARCYGKTSKAFARANGGNCKACATGTAPRATSARRSGPCEDAPCCGCCGPQGDGDFYGGNR